MSNSNKLKTFNVKRDKKLQAKKRKLEAFLNLVRQDESNPTSNKKKSGGSFQQNYKALKEELKKYQKAKSNDPTFSLKEDGRCAIVDLSLNGEIPSPTLPLFSEDIHHLLLMSVLGNVSPFPLRWATLKCAQSISKTILIEIEGLSQQDVKEMYSELNENDNLFQFVVEIISSDIPFATDLSTMHLATNSYGKNKDNYSSMFPMVKTSEMETTTPTPGYKFSKLHLLLSPIQLAMEHYPLPQTVFEQSKSEGYCFSKDAYTAVHDNSPMFAVDCEMCKTLPGRQEVTRIAIVNENLETIYHTLVKPKDDIIDYVTRFSGITEKMLRHVKTTLEDVQRDMCRILPSDAILCGQSLNCDLHGLKMIHPYIIDTSIIFNEHGVRHKKTSLKQLARIHLKENIQDGKRGHNPIEDSIATMKLVQLKLKNGIEYGDAILSGGICQNNASTNDDEKDTSASAANEKCEISDSLKSSPDAKENGFFSKILRFSKTACLIGNENSLNNYCEEMITENVTKVIKTKTQKILKVVTDSIENHDLIISHLSLDNCSVKELKDEIKQAYASMPNKTLFIILMSGVNKQPNDKFKHSYCMLTLKK